MSSEFRLIRTFVPEHYDLSIKFHRVERSFEGTVTIRGVVPKTSPDIRLHAKNLTINSVVFDGKQADFTQDPNDELAISHQDISEGQHILVIGYTGVITDDMNGIYPCYFEVDGQKQELIATQFESHAARQAFPCVDEPEAKATFNVTLSTEKNVTVLGNMPIKAQTTEGDWLVTNFQTTPRMSTYLVAWVVGDLHKKTAHTKSGVEVSIWATKAHSASSLDFALDIATRTIDFFNDYFGVPYPLPKSDHVALPDFSAGAMENWGLITYREIALLVDPKKTSLSTKQQAATVIAHELSHQWFGNLVTMEWWNDLWLNESFANMMEYAAIDALEPEWDIWLEFAIIEVIGALRRDSLDGVQAIQADINHPDEISTIFDPSIVYAKGGRLLRMLQAYIGDKAMKNGLKMYFDKHQYKNTRANDLWTALGGASGKDVAAFMNTWMTQPGFPVVHATKTGEVIKLTQKQFFIGAHKSQNRNWPIPLHATDPSVPSIMRGQEISFTYKSDRPFRLNTGSTAHYITHYDAGLLKDIISNFKTLSPIDKLGFLNEQLMLAKAGMQSYSALIPLLSNLRYETNEAVWSVAALIINELKRFVEADETSEKRLKLLTAGIVSEQYARLGWDAKTNEDENDTKLRSLIISLAIYGEISDAIETADSRYFSLPVEKLDSELRGAIMANAVRQGVDKSVIDTLLAAYSNTTNNDLKNDISSALTSTKNIRVVKKLAELLKDTKTIRTQDFLRWFVWLIRNRYGRDYMWQWFQDNWTWVVDRFKDDTHYDSFPSYIASVLVSKDHLEGYRTFFKPLETDIALVRNIKIGYIELEATVKLLAIDGPKVRQALLKLPDFD